MWHPVLDRLAAERDVIAPDCRAMGVARRYRHGGRHRRRYADVVEELRRQRGSADPRRGQLAWRRDRPGRWVPGAARHGTALSPIGFWTPPRGALLPALDRFAARSALVEPVARAVLGSRASAAR